MSCKVETTAKEMACICGSPPNTTGGLVCPVHGAGFCIVYNPIRLPWFKTNEELWDRQQIR